MILLLDNYDSFTFMLQDYLGQLGPECITWQHDQCTLADIEALAPEAIVLSPGPKRPEDAGITMDAIDYFHTKLPILGICLGHEAIGSYFGGSVIKCQKPMHGKTSAITHNNDALFQEIPTTFRVMRYHSLIVSLNSDTPLSLIAKTEQEGIVMALRHQYLPIYSCQFHPESIQTEHGLRLLANWMAIVGIATKRPSGAPVS